MKSSKFYADLETKIIQTYEEGIAVEAAERLAAEFLRAQLVCSADLAKADLDARMRKTGVKAVRAAIYTATCSGADKKPTEAAIEHSINSNDVVQQEQNGLDEAEVTRNELERYFSVFQNAHIYYRGIAKGNFNA